ncbi:kinesin, partial [Zopfia rhizophila CBS 207.26]
ICVLSIKLTAAQVMLDEEDDGLSQNSFNSTPYTLGRISDYNIILVYLPAEQISTHSAATAATQMTSKFTSIRISLMVNISGGVPSTDTDIQLRDVVISQPHQ